MVFESFKLVLEEDKRDGRELFKSSAQLWRMVQLVSLGSILFINRFYGSLCFWIGWSFPIHFGYTFYNKCSDRAGRGSVRYSNGLPVVGLC